jgi:hypothetical protein
MVYRAQTHQGRPLPTKPVKLIDREGKTDTTWISIVHANTDTQSIPRTTRYDMPPKKKELLEQHAMRHAC